MTFQSDFNLWIASNYYRGAINICSRFTDKGVEERLAARLSCTWHVKHGFGLKAPKDDEYFNGNQMGRTSVDALVAHPEFDPAGDVLFNCWLDYKAKLDARRNGGPIKIDPPPPTPPEPKPSPEPSKQQNGDVQQPRKKLPWKLIATVLSAISFGLTFFPVPGIVKEIINYAVKILREIPG
jgi:hypothetical protein